MKPVDEIKGAGLGLRREMLDDALAKSANEVDFWEVAPENWMRLGGKFGKQFRQLTECHQFLCHGLSLSIGAPQPLDLEFVRQVKAFLDAHQISLYSEHLSYCSGYGHLYDLLPIPFTEEAALYVADRVKQVQEILERPLVLENVSYYAAPGQEINELDFINRVLEEADCELLLDVNNIYVNSVNHGYDPVTFLRGLPSKRIRYIHVAGHYNEADDLIVDTHGADVIDPVWNLLKEAYRFHGVLPTLLERDFNLPPMKELLLEVDKIRQIQQSIAVEPEVLIA
ncbi:DUF692 domain-containing protein [Corallincola holothuriorum]|uniref:UPF0276 protein DU002_10840 n=1 Tax=Corallincola holothuriorum TaxID=2282215 RepID=A0A368NGW1_9GAMM|nr:DUF692 domain-containing protein [Corallincola holothuriorum]RCU49416.1 DUF692 domain-containing protein [Corallincola holothuriorum]